MDEDAAPSMTVVDSADHLPSREAAQKLEKDNNAQTALEGRISRMDPNLVWFRANDPAYPFAFSSYKKICKQY